MADVAEIPLLNKADARQEVIARLQQEVYSLQRFKKVNNVTTHTIGPFETAFPNQSFPTGAVHEFISYEPEDAAATNGFISGILSHLAGRSGYSIWVGSARVIFPPALKFFGIDPEHIIFLEVSNKDILWTVEEALKCQAVSAVVGILPEITFKESRRLQLAVEQSHVTGFIHRYKPKTENITACVSRFKIRSIHSATLDGLPGVGYPHWQADIVKVRNGKPDSWQLQWNGSGFEECNTRQHIISIPQKLKAG